jgi:hypothetical protein
MSPSMDHHSHVSLSAARCVAATSGGIPSPASSPCASRRCRPSPICTCAVPLISRAAPLSAPHLRRCGRLAAENKFSGTLPASIAEMPSLRQLCAAPCSPRPLPMDALHRLPLISCRNVRYNLLEGDVSPIARMNSTMSAAASNSHAQTLTRTPARKPTGSAPTVSVSSRSEGHAPALLCVSGKTKPRTRSGSAFRARYFSRVMRWSFGLLHHGAGTGTEL